MKTNYFQQFATLSFTNFFQNQVHKEPENIIDGQELAMKYEIHVKEFFKYEGGFQLLDLIINDLLKIQGLSLLEILFAKKNPLQDLLPSLKAVISTNERH